MRSEWDEEPDWESVDLDPEQLDAPYGRNSYGRPYTMDDIRSAYDDHLYLACKEGDY